MPIEINGLVVDSQRSYPGEQMEDLGLLMNEWLDEQSNMF